MKNYSYMQRQVALSKTIISMTIISINQNIQNISIPSILYRDGLYKSYAASQDIAYPSFFYIESDGVCLVTSAVWQKWRKCLKLHGTLSLSLF